MLGEKPDNICVQDSPPKRQFVIFFIGGLLFFWKMEYLEHYFPEVGAVNAAESLVLSSVGDHDRDHDHDHFLKIIMIEISIMINFLKNDHDLDQKKDYN